jgi:hypothetical protein
LPELRWAFDNGVIGAQIVVDVATALMHAGDDSNVVTRLASVTHADLPDVREILSNVPVDNEESDAAHHKWVWLVLSWLYEHHRDDADVFDKIDSLYADFGYPQEMLAFGPYAPAYQAKGDPKEQREEVVREWQRFVSRGEESFGRS